MVNAIVASLAVFGASAAALSVGTAKVVNKCNYDVYLCNVPSANGGYEESDTTLAAGESWDQTYTELSNGNGWSIKLSKSSSLDNILQYEYTFHDDGIIWYDLSCVNGNPWDQDWEITASGGDCSPKQQAYRYATDDAYGMQSCAQDADITVTLCTGVSADAGNSTDSGSDSSSSSSSSASSYESTSTSAPSYESTSASAPSYESSTSTSEEHAKPTWSWKKAAEAKPTTFATSASVVETDASGATVTEVETAYVTAVVTAYANRHRRHEHGHAHQHNA